MSAADKTFWAPQPYQRALIDAFDRHQKVRLGIFLQEQRKQPAKIPLRQMGACGFRGDVFIDEVFPEPALQAALYPEEGK